jgi:hypothetical protein
MPIYKVSGGSIWRGSTTTSTIEPHLGLLKCSPSGTQSVAPDRHCSLQETV